MPATTSGPATSRRLALPLSVGLALWLFAPRVLALLGVYDSDDGSFPTWTLTVTWVITTAGAALTLVCTYLLARRLEAHLLTRHQRPPAGPPTPGAHRRRSPATVLVAGGASVTALPQLWWVSAGPLPSWALTLLDVVGGLVAPAALVLGVHLALRRLEDHLAGRRRDRTSSGSSGGDTRHASGLTSPYVIDPSAG